jgi:small conductance mechanosensitive channel
MTPLTGLLAQADPGLADACGNSPSWVCEWIYDVTDNDSVARILDWVIAKPLTVLFIFGIAWLLNRLARRAIRKLVDTLIKERDRKAAERRRAEVEDGRFAVLSRAMEKARRIDEQAERSKQRAQALGTVLRSVAALTIYGIAAFIVLSEFGVNIGPLIASAGIVGVALGFGAQTLVRDFLSGIFMLVEDQYGVGDVIDVGEANGVVEEIRLRTTRLRDVNGTVWFVPNGEIKRVANKSQQWARAVLDVDVAYDTDLAQAAAVIKDVADAVWREELEIATVLEEPEIWGVERFGADAISIRLVVKVEPGEQWAVSREIRKRLKVAFDEAGIEIPFPQRTIWMHEVPADRRVVEEHVTPPSAIEDIPSGGSASEGDVGDE